MNLGARTAMWSSGAKMPTARDYVQDGLIHMWDGVENARFGVHKANATEWTDLIGGVSLPYTGTMIIKDKFASIDGGGTWVLRPDMDFSKLTSGWTIDGVCSTRSDNTGVRFSIGDSCQITFLRNSDNLTSFTSSNIRQGVGGNGSIFVYGIKYDPISISLTCDITTREMVAYVDGVSVGKTANGAIAGDQYGRSGYGIAKDWYSNGVNGDYYCFRVYNRALTADEIAANYAIDKARFGLP